MSNILQLETPKLLKSLNKSEIKDVYYKAIELDSIKYETSISDIIFLNNSSISINGSEVKITDNAYVDLLNVCKLSESADSSFKKIIKHEKTYNLLNNLKKEFVNNSGDFNVVLYGNSNTKSIVKIKKRKKVEYIDNEKFLEFSFDIINKHNLQIIDFKVDSSGKILLQAVPDFNQFKINGNFTSSEDFYRGIIFSNDLTSSKMIPSILRIKCLNQLSSIDTENSLYFDTIDEINLKKMHTTIESLKEINYIPRHLERQIQRAYETPASINEYNSIVNLVKNNSDIDKEKLDYFFDYDFISSSIKDFTENEKIELNHNLNTKIPINKTVYELINGATYYASNSSEHELNNSQKVNIFNGCGKIINGDKNGFYDLYFKSVKIF